MEFNKVKIVTFVPKPNAEDVRKALGDAGAGRIGEYSYCSFSVSGEGRFMPMNNSNPNIGKINKQEVVEEDRIEVVCNRSDAKAIIAALKQSHPYEEVGFDIYPIIEENDL